MTDTQEPRRTTLDGQLVRYWEREAARFDELAARASFKWMVRSYMRRAERARSLARTSRTRDAARSRDAGPEIKDDSGR